MNPKQIIAGSCFVLAASLGVVALTQSHAEAPDEDAATPTLVTVQTGALKLATLHRYVSGYGTVETAPATAGMPAAEAAVSAATPGMVVKVNVFEGQQVAKGDLLVELNSSTITAEYAAQQVERQKNLYAQQNTSLKNVQDAELQLALLRVTAPMSGTVVSLNVRPGQAVDVTTVMMELMDLNRLVVSAPIPAAAAGQLRSGQAVEIMTDPPVTTEISFISPLVDKSNDTVLVRALLPAGSGLRPGQFVPLSIVTDIHTNALAAPVESVVTDEDGRSVIALVKGDQAVRTPVQTGLREAGLVEVTAADLKAGDTIVTVGAYGLPEKTKIRLPGAAAEETTPTNSTDASTNPATGATHSTDAK
jgi:multidrug efflux pump subunit AcrA (membrane-fusion protein)